ncbi:MAG TPA: glycoside hydrolase family 78 protein [Candidatus Blautia faecigallinarum]|uniref:alpha-L-rhamnosidase n=1 Tax=Candidatus Blautia faecigallinarum TaxID=2838488 RepID=A0A9D2DT00_9FIRM|nr:glycoside hydrolase family 78 protein [Candidatus Blautia faecigallinarum]
MKEWNGKWIRPKEDMGDVCPVFQKKWKTDKTVKKAELYLTALGVYEAKLNGKPVGEFVLAPGWTTYEKRLQYQRYDVTGLLKEENELDVILGKGWYSSQMPGWMVTEDRKRRTARRTGILGELHLAYEDGTEEVLPTDGSWNCAKSQILFSEIYDGETCDASYLIKDWEAAAEFDGPYEILIPQEGEEIREMERVAAKSVFVTPAGETLVDFGQEVTGYVEFTVDAKKGDKITILHGEVLDQKGNFYNANYRSAKAEIHYTCADGVQTWHPQLTFFGFRYIKLEEFPGEAKPEQFTAIVVYSNIKKTGELRCSNPDLNQLFSNIFWGQKGNFVDVPTDCPQRDERLGWTGDAQVFIKTASYNYDTQKFYKKWLHDLAAEQRPDGAVGQVIPDYLPEGAPSAAWGDAAAICPWQVYLTYGDKEVLADQFDSMKKWVDYITGATKDTYLWTGGEHFGDWLGLDAPSGSYKGSTREDFIASAFYAYSTSLVIKAGKILGEDVAKYEELYRNILSTFRKTYTDYRTQTEYILAIWFDLAEDPQKCADALAAMIEKDGSQMRTGFVGTPYILHVLSHYGYTELAYKLLLRKEYPSWLYAVDKGATTIWEHWDGIMENGEFWSTDMNSFNHYAYGAVADWVYEEAAGIHVLEEAPGFEKIRIQPKASKALDWLEASIETRKGLVKSRWTWQEDGIKYEITTPVDTTIVIGGREMEVRPGCYTFWG